MSAFAAIICAAIVIEGIITYVKMLFTDDKFQWQMVVGIALGIVVAVAYGLDVFALFNMSSNIPFIGCVLTGILLSRGSNYIFDLINIIKSFIDKLKAE